MFTPFFNTPDNHRKYKEYIRMANGYCLACNRPTIKEYCPMCIKDLVTRGLEARRVTFGEVGRTCINYQQYLHTSFFKCNVLYKYRGIKEDRIKAKVSEQTLITATMDIRNLLSCKSYVYLEKRYSKRTTVVHKYHEIRDTRNFDRRILYNITLFYICYHIENKLFKTEAHFYASLIYHIDSYIKETNYKLTKIKQDKREVEINKYYLYYIQELNKLITPVMKEIVF